jgi:hypothetical protein
MIKFRIMWVVVIDAESTVCYLESIGKDFNFIISKLMERLNIDFDEAYDEFLKYTKVKPICCYNYLGYERNYL